MDGRSYARTLEEKRVSMEKLLAPYLPEGWRPRITGMDDPFHYRNKVHRTFGAVSKGRKKVWTSGIYREGTHEIIEVRDCLIEDRRAVETLTRVRKLIDDFHLPYYDEDTGNGLIRHLLVRTAHKTGEMLLVIVTGSTWFPGKKNFAEALRKHCPEITTAVLNLNDRRTSLILGPKDTVLYGRGFIEDELAGLRFRISASSFYQVNSLMTEKLYQKAIQFAALTPETSVIDAYSGIGTIGMAAAGSAKDVLSIELNENAVRDARKNAERNGLQNVHFLRADATEALAAMAADSPYGDGSRLVLFMDPPRQGSTPEFIRAAVSMNPARIVYISCGPEALARDLRLFAKLGYKAREAECFDMFPFTGHVETVVLLRRDEKEEKKMISDEKSRYKSWSNLKSQMNDLLCDSLKDKIQYFYTTYHEVHNAYGRATINYTKKEMVAFSWVEMYAQEYEMSQLYKEGKKISYGEMEKKKWMPEGKLCEIDFINSITIYLKTDISSSLTSDNLLLRVFAYMDRRVGKRTLIRIKDDVEKLPEWVKQFYRLRCEAENINFQQNQTTDESVVLMSRA